jgi:hypothetical protein
MTVIGIPADVCAFVHNEHTLVQASGEAFRQYAPGKARSDDEIIKHRLNGPPVPNMLRSH